MRSNVFEASASVPRQTLCFGVAWRVVKNLAHRKNGSMELGEIQTRCAIGMFVYVWSWLCLFTSISQFWWQAYFCIAEFSMATGRNTQPKPGSTSNAGFFPVGYSNTTSFLMLEQDQFKLGYLLWSYWGFKCYFCIAWESNYRWSEMNCRLEWVTQ